jgi:pyruvate dehydrogenase E2 component (dihydrolipoamide acetyltransferase)
MAVEFYIHKMSEHMDTAEIIQWLVAEGQPVAMQQAIVEVMTDKFAVELEAPVAGILAGIRPGCEKGAVVPVGEPIAYIVKPGETPPVLLPFGASATTPAGHNGAAPAPGDTGSSPTSAAGPEGSGRVKATPVARRMAKDLGVDIEQVRGTGPGGRVVEADIRAFAAGASPAAQPVSIPSVLPAVEAPLLPAAPKAPHTVSAPLPATPASPVSEGEFRWQELTPVQRITGERMRESVVNAPQFALELAADATNLLWLQEALTDRITLQARGRLSLTGLLVKIVAETLLRHPRANAEFSDGRIKLHGDVNIGVAIGTDDGLVVPVITQAAHKDLAVITSELVGFQEKARTLHFSATDLAGGTFTISNLGMYGVERFTAIVNPPQSAILAVGAVTRRPVALADGTVGVRPLLELTLTVDHRVMDGVQAARFLGELKQKIEKPYFVIA